MKSSPVQFENADAAPFESPQHSEIHKSQKEVDALIELDVEMRDQILDAAERHSRMTMTIPKMFRNTASKSYSDYKKSRSFDVPAVTLGKLHEHL